MRKLLMLLTTILVIFLIACGSYKEIETEEIKEDVFQTTSTDNNLNEYKLAPLKESVTTNITEEFMKFSHTVITENEKVVAVQLKFEGKRTVQTMCENIEQVEEMLNKIACETFIVDNKGTEIHFTKSQILAVLRETF